MLPFLFSHLKLYEDTAFIPLHMKNVKLGKLKGLSHCHQVGCFQNVNSAQLPKFREFICISLDFTDYFPPDLIPHRDRRCSHSILHDPLAWNWIAQTSNPSQKSRPVLVSPVLYSSTNIPVEYLSDVQDIFHIIF